MVRNDELAIVSVMNRIRNGIRIPALRQRPRTRVTNLSGLMPDATGAAETVGSSGVGVV